MTRRRKLSSNAFEIEKEKKKYTMKSKMKRNASDQMLMDGIVKHIGKTGVIVLKGEKRKVADLLALLQKRIDASKPVEPAKGVWLQLVEEEQRVLEETDADVAALKQYVAVVHGATLQVLADFGIVPKARRELTVEEKNDQLAKAKATRTARGTLGRRQREKVKGAVAAPDPTPAPPATNSVH